MAYLQDFKDDEEDKAGQKTLTADNTVTGPTPAGAPAGAATPAPAVPSGSGFVNFNKYLDANKEQSGRMATDVVNPIQQNIGQERTQRADTGAAVEKTASENTIRDQGIISALQADPTKVDKAAYQKQTGGYKGPTSAAELTPYQDLTKIQASNQQNVGMLGNASGLETKLGETYGKNPYTKGSRVLDTALTSTGQGGDVLRGVQKDYAGLTPLSDLTAQFDKRLADAKAISDATAKQTQDALAAQIGRSETSFEDKQKGLKDETASLAKQLGDAKLALQRRDSASLAPMGIDPMTAEFLGSHGYDLNKLVSATGARGLGDVISQQEQDRYNALTRLGDQASKFSFDKTGAEAPSLKYNTQDISTGKQLTDLLMKVSQKQTAEQTKRDAEYKAAKALADKAALTGDIAGNAQKLGLSPDDYKFGVEQGLITPDMFSAGKRLNIGDVGSDVRPVYDQLIASLGLTNTPSLVDTQDEGNAWSFNSADALGKLQAYKAKQIDDARRADLIAREKVPVKAPTTTSTTSYGNSRIDNIIDPGAATINGQYIDPARPAIKKAADYVTDTINRVTGADIPGLGGPSGTLLNTAVYGATKLNPLRKFGIGF